jgi:hypothetical protein
MEVIRKKRIYLRELEDLELLVEIMKNNGIEDIFAKCDEAIVAKVVTHQFGENEENVTKYVEFEMEDWD